MTEVCHPGQKFTVAQAGLLAFLLFQLPTCLDYKVLGLQGVSHHARLPHRHLFLELGLYYISYSKLPSFLPSKAQLAPSNIKLGHIFHENRFQTPTGLKI